MLKTYINQTVGLPFSTKKSTIGHKTICEEFDLNYFWTSQKHLWQNLVPQDSNWLPLHNTSWNFCLIPFFSYQSLQEMTRESMKSYIFHIRSMTHSRVDPFHILKQQSNYDYLIITKIRIMITKGPNKICTGHLYLGLLKIQVCK